MVVKNIIDRRRPIEMFQSLVTQKDGKKILWLAGNPKMGKSRLLQEFKKIGFAAKYHVAMMDLRSKVLSYEDILSSIADQLTNLVFENYEIARNEYLGHSQVRISQVNQFFSMMKVENQNVNREEFYKKKLSSAFAKDLRLRISETNTTAILFDSFEQADDKIQGWLSDQLMLSLASIPNLIIVMAGRALPTPPSSILDICESYTLPPVTVEDQKQYCREMGFDIEENIIEAFHKAFEGTPGLFAEFVPNLKK